MFNTNGGYSLSDIAAVTGSNGNNNNGDGWGMGNGGAWWIIILFLFVFCGWGNGNNGWGNRGNDGGGFNSPAGQGALTRADLCSEFSFNDLQGGVRGLSQGLCDGFYAVNTGMLNGFAGVNSAICSLGYEQAQLANGTNVALMQGQNALATQLADCCCKTQSGLKDVAYQNAQGQNAIQTQIAQGDNAIQTQLAQCCCDLGNQLERGFANTRYDMATNTCAIQTSMANSTRDIIDSQNAGTRAILDYLCQEKIADLQSENQSLRLAASQQAQNNYLVSQLRPCPQPAYLTCNPFTGQTYGGCGGYGCGNGCG